MRLALIFLILTISSSADSKEAAPIDYGAPIIWEEYKPIAERALLSHLIDPASAQISWPYGIARISTKVFFGPRISGWLTCGTVNSKNRMGGYAGQSFFYVTVKDGQAIDVQVGSSSNDFDIVTTQCQNIIKKGMLPPATKTEFAQATDAPIPPGQPSLGVGFVQVPDGLYVKDVVPGSAAEKVGILQGMVVTALNGVSIKGVEPSVAAAMIRSTNGPITLSVVGHADIVVTKQLN